MTTNQITIRQEPKIWPQLLAASTIHILSVLAGLAGGWTSPYLAKLTKGSETLIITNDEASWIASLSHLSQPVGSILGAVTVYKFGAKKALLFAGLPYALSWSCFLIRESVSWIYVSKLLSGIGFGIYSCSYPLYIGEIGNPKIRGALIGLVAEGKAIGLLLGNLLGAYLTMRTFAMISLMLTAIFLFSFAFFPESSHYLVKRNKIEEAEESLKWYNRQTDVTFELGALKMYIEDSRAVSLIESVKTLSSPMNRKNLLMLIIIYSFIQLSGVYTITMYLEILLTALKVDVVAPSLVVISVAIVAIPAGLISMYTNDHFGRRTMLAVSTFGVSINFALIGCNFLILKHGYSGVLLQWLMIMEIMLYMVFLHLGITHIPSCLLGEIFSPELKEICSCIVNILYAFIAFVGSRSYQPLLEATSEEFIFFFYAFLILLMFIYTSAVVPETRGKSLPEIQEMLKKKWERIGDGQNNVIIESTKC